MSSIVKLALAAALAAVTATACTSETGNTTPDAGSSPDAAMVVPCEPVAGAPTYTQLYTTYFAAGTPGHCAKEECHGTSHYAIWSCGASKDTCYNGMVNVGIISKTNPKASIIGDAANSPLRWVNSRGAMPADNQTANNAGRDAVKAWVASCALNN